MPPPPSLAASVQGIYSEATKTKRTKTINDYIDDTLQELLLKILFAEGLGDGLANSAQLLMNAAMSSNVRITSVSAHTNVASSAMVTPTEELRATARRAWQSARDNHSRERFSEEFRKAVELALAYNVHAGTIGSRSPDT